jgi:hypothetical protein
MKKSPSVKRTAAKSSAGGAGNRVQGEGDYEAARRYRSKIENFVRTADIEGAARAAAPKNKRDAAEMAAAEAAGRSHAKVAPRKAKVRSAK